MGNRLELTWYGKEEPIKVEPRLLIHDEKKDFGDTSTGNMLIHGDNLLALKALEQDFSGQVKCIYIDPPFNTGQAFEHYDDNLEMSIWLGLIRDRVKILHKLLTKEGTIFVHIDDENLPYIAILMDEIFGKSNRLYMITFKQGAATGHKAINPGCVTTTNYILMYAKDKNDWKPNKVYTKRNRDNRYGKYIVNIDAPYTEWKIITLTEAFAEYKKVDIKEARKIIKNAPDEIEKFVVSHAESVIRTARPDIKNVGKEIQEKVRESVELKNQILFLERENNPDMFFVNGERLLFYKDKLKKIDGELVSAEPLTTLWDDLLSNNLHNEGGVSFPKGKKPEFLIKRVLELASNPNDLILDSFLGSGTTAAVAQKMGRRWIGIEMGEHAYTHCKKRLDKVISGEDQGGISKSVEWKGGGGYRFYELAPSLINYDEFEEPVINKEYNADMLAAAVALHEGYTYRPDTELFWKQAYGTENSYLFVTTRHLTGDYLDAIIDTMKESEFLIIACKSYDKMLENISKRVVIKKIPQMLLTKCEFGKEDYNLNIINPPIYDEEEAEDE